MTTTFYRKISFNLNNFDIIDELEYIRENYSYGNDLILNNLIIMLDNLHNIKYYSLSFFENETKLITICVNISSGLSRYTIKIKKLDILPFIHREDLIKCLEIFEHQKHLLSYITFNSDITLELEYSGKSYINVKTMLTNDGSIPIQYYRIENDYELVRCDKFPISGYITYVNFRGKNQSLNKVSAYITLTTS